MSSLKSIGIDVGVIAKGLNYRVSLFNQRLTDTENQVSTLPFEPSDITDWESCGCGEIDTIPSALDKLAELRALTADRVTALEQGGGSNGQDGADGASAYEIAVGNGFSGTEAEWLESLIGEDGADGTNGTNGVDGSDGDSAYQVAVNNGFTGTEAEWLVSLQGADGADGVDGTNGTGGFTNWSEDSNGHIIPASNATYDIGSAERKVRHFYLSDNSLQIGGEGDEIAFVANKEYFLGTATKVSLGNIDTRLKKQEVQKVYQKSNLPLGIGDGQSVLVTDGADGDTPAMSYFYQGKYYRSADNVVISDKIIDIYLLAGQSNAHGHADVSTLTADQSSQDGLFYSSWHETTSNASSTQYYSDWASSLEAGSTRGDDNTSVLGGSSKFGPEIGFIKRANEISLSGNKPIGIIKHAIGASTLTDEGTDYSDWDITAEGDRRGDALRAFKRSVEDGLGKLDEAGYSYRIAGLIWWQGESGSSVSGLNDLLDHFRDYLDTQFTLDMSKSELPIVITKIGYGTDLTPVADGNAYVGIVDAGQYGHSDTQNHLGDPSDGSADTNSNGINDMLEIGEAFADKMQLAIGGNTAEPWNPESITTRLWLDMDDQSTFTSSDGNVTAIDDKSGNGYTFNAESGSTLTAVDAEQNNKNILRFDNNSDATSFKYIDFSSTAVHKWFFVVKVTSSDSHDGLITFSKSNPTLQILMFNLSGSGVFSGDWYFNPGTNMTGNATNLLNQWAILSIELDVPNSRATASLNGTAYNTDVSQSGLSTMGAGQVKLNDYQNNADSDWGEVIFVEDASQADSEKIEGYLAHKWGLTDSLPSSHPYKTQMP